MNVLAHLHLAFLAGSSLVGNSAADFIKGDPYSVYNEPIASGVKLHRRIDALTDSLPDVLTAKSLFPASHQRLAGITLDIIWDHFLARHWAQYVSAVSLREFNTLMQAILSPQIQAIPVGYQEFMHYLWQDEWLLNYANLPFVEKVLHGMAKRRPRLAQLPDTFTGVVIHYDKLALIFDQFYPRMCQQAIARKL